MDIFFQDPTAIPLPPQDVRITELRAEPWPDGRRVKVHIELTPFLKRPNVDVCLLNRNGEELAAAAIIESMEPRMEFTLHLRGAELLQPYSLDAVVFYLDAPEGVENPDEIPPDQRTKIIVDQRSQPV